MIKFENIGMRYGTGPEVLHDVSLDLPAGSFHFLTGPSGAGKTSLMRLMYLGMRPTRGILNMFGKDIATQSREDLMKLRRRIGVVFQEFRLMDHMSVFDNVALPLRISGLKESQITSNVAELINWVGLGDFMHVRPSTLSGGQQQRVAIARAVINHPTLLLADEPTGNLDDKMGFRLMALFEELNRHGTTVVIATHNEILMDHYSQHPRIRLDEGTITHVGHVKKKDELQKVPA